MSSTRSVIWPDSRLRSRNADEIFNWAACNFHASSHTSRHGKRSEQRSHPVCRRRDALLVAWRGRALSPVSRRRVGLPGRRRSPPVREDLPRRVPGRSQLADDPPEAAAFPPRVCTASTSSGSRIRSARRLPPADDEGIVRHRGKIESTINNAKRALDVRSEFGSLAAYFWQWEPDPDRVPACSPDARCCNWPTRQLPLR